MLVRKAACRVVLARVINSMLAPWPALPEAEQNMLQDALVATLADLTAEFATGVKAPTREQFLEFMGKSYDYSDTKRQALETGAYL